MFALAHLHGGVCGHIVLRSWQGIEDAGGVVGGKDRGGCQQEQGGEGAAHLGNVAEGEAAGQPRGAASGVVGA